MGCHFLLQCMKVKGESEVAQSCPTPSDPMDCSPPGSSVPGIFQARVLEWGAIAFSLIHYSYCITPHACVLSRFGCVRLFVTPWTIVRQAPLSMGFSRQGYWSGCHFLLQGIFLTQGSSPHLQHVLRWQADSLPTELREKPMQISYLGTI